MKLFHRPRSGVLILAVALAVLAVAGGRWAMAANVDLRDGGAVYRGISPSSLYPGQSVVVQGSAYNAGTTAAGAFYVGIYLSIDNIITTGDIYLGRYSYSSLVATTRQSFVKSVVVPAATIPGNYYIGYYVDYLGQVAESAENNNSAFLSSPMLSVLNNPPDKPTLQTPVNGATGQSLTPTLTASAYHDQNGDSHWASHWLVDDNSNFSSPTYNSGTTTASKTSIAVPAGRLSASTIYYWSVRYRDNRGAWGSWANGFWFRTSAGGGSAPNRPTLTSPADGATGLSRTPVLQASAFSDPNSDSHLSSQWQADNDSDFSSPAFDSGATTTFKTSVPVPSGMLTWGITYFWRVRYMDSTGLWSSWSFTRVFSTKSRPPNDYDGDGKSDLTVYNSGNRRWRINYSGAGETNIVWGFLNTATVCGDYNGDGKSDLGIFNNATGRWSIITSDGSGLLNDFAWGRAGATTVSGDYDGDGASDLAVYNENTGKWSIWSVAKNAAIAQDLAWGWTGAKPVAGDYDGDGVSDLAVLDINIGHWFIYSLAKQNAIAWNLAWGWAGCAYVPGDYDGDGRSDLAVYDRNTSHWFIYSLPKKKALAWYLPWGFPGAAPVSGDYDGDGRTDLAVYDQTNGKWYIETLTGTILVWNQDWGGPAAAPVKP